MNEMEWLESKQPEPMLNYLRGAGSSRKMRLFAAACCCRIKDYLNERSLHALAAVERHIEGAAIDDELRNAYLEAEEAFRQLSDPYERLYYAGILYERRAKAQLNAGQPPHTLLPLFEQALRSFAEAEKIRPAGNDDAILRWNRCVRLLQNSSYGLEELEFEGVEFEAADTPPR